jgi:hypothetical protein
MESVGLFLAMWSMYLFSIYFVAVCHILWLFGTYFPVLVCCTKKYLATLLLIAELTRGRRDLNQTTEAGTLHT